MDNPQSTRALDKLIHKNLYKEVVEVFHGEHPDVETIFNWLVDNRTKIVTLLTNGNLDDYRPTRAFKKAET